MIDFTLMSSISPPGLFRSFLVQRGLVAANEGDPPPLQGVEYTLHPVPNPIVNQLAVGVPGDPGYIPPVPDPRYVNLLRLAGPDAEEEGENLVVWIINNSMAVSIHGADGAQYDSQKINGQNVWWILPEDKAAFGGWQ